MTMQAALLNLLTHVSTPPAMWYSLMKQLKMYHNMYTPVQYGQHITSYKYGTALLDVLERDEDIMERNSVLKPLTHLFSREIFLHSPNDHQECPQELGIYFGEAQRGLVTRLLGSLAQVLTRCSHKALLSPASAEQQGGENTTRRGLGAGRIHG